MDMYSIFMFIAVSTSKLFTKKKYCILMGIFLFLIAALRSTSVGTDSLQYYKHFNIIQVKNIQEILIYYPKEPVFMLFLKLLSQISSHHQLMYSVIGLFYSVSISRFIYKYSNDAMVSFVMLVPMIYFTFSLSALRQTMAISILLVSIDYIINKRIFRFMFLIILASLFHKSAIFFLPAYLLNYSKISSNKVLLLLNAIPLIFLLRRQLIITVQYFMYSNYTILDKSSGGTTTFIVYFLILLVAMFYRKSIQKINKAVPLFFYMMSVGMFLQMFVPLQPNIFRISMYYNIASIILIPSFLVVHRDKVTKLVAYSFFFILMFIQYYMFTYFSAGANPYNFFWQ